MESWTRTFVKMRGQCSYLILANVAVAGGGVDSPEFPELPPSFLSPEDVSNFARPFATAPKIKKEHSRNRIL